MDNWEELAKALPTGQKRKIPCCSSSPSAYISNSRKGLGYYCFRCETKHFKSHGRRSAAEIMAARNAVREIKSSRTIPDRCIPLNNAQTPNEAVLWVLQAGLTPEEATSTYGFMYDPKTRRVNIPIEGGFLARSIFGERPKYIKAGSDTELYPIKTQGSDLIVVCEDIMSAIKVSKAGYNSVAILGTAITVTSTLYLSRFDTVVCWTDGDKAGDAAWIKMRRGMALYSSRIVRVRTSQDPKELHLAEIRHRIEESYGRTI